MKKLHFVLGAAAGMLMFANSAMAAPTAAGVTISNQATAEYSVATTSYTASSATITFRVAQIVNVTVSNMDGAEIAVAPSDTGKATTFKVTNTGNGLDNFIFSADSVAGYNFLPEFSSIMIDTNNSGLNDAGDTPYAAGSAYPLAAGQSVTLFVLNTIPAGVNGDEIGKTQLKAQSRDFNTGAPGVIFTGFGFEGVDAVLGVQDGARTSEGTYKVTGVKVNLFKSSVVSDVYGKNSAVPGSTVTYTIVAKITGTGTAKGLKIIDTIPANTTYKFGSLKLNGGVLTDGVDLDAADASPTVVTFNLGDVVGGTPDQTVSFQVTIN